MNNYQRPHSPFEDSAIERLRRMGLTTEDGSPERDAMAVFSSIFAGQFFDDLCDYYQNYKDVQETIAPRAGLIPQFYIAVIIPHPYPFDNHLKMK